MKVDLSGIKYCVLALGSSIYPDFCRYGIRVDKWLSLTGAESILPLYKADDAKGYTSEVANWMDLVERLVLPRYCPSRSAVLQSVLKRLYNPGPLSTAPSPLHVPDLPTPCSTQFPPIPCSPLNTSSPPPTNDSQNPSKPPRKPLNPLFLCEGVFRFNAMLDCRLPQVVRLVVVRAPSFQAQACMGRAPGKYWNGRTPSEEGDAPPPPPLYPRHAKFSRREVPPPPPL